MLCCRKQRGLCRAELVLARSQAVFVVGKSLRNITTEYSHAADTFQR
jgi:hypothetical protein